MRIEQLKQVIKIAECGSFSKAASELYLSQSNLSLSIKNLESEISHAIFERTSKGVQLTSFGGEFINYAIATCNQYDLTAEFCKSFCQTPQLHFSASAQHLYFASLAFVKLLEKYNTSAKNFSFKDGSLMEVLKNVMHNHSEIGIIILSKVQKKTTLNFLQSRGLAYTSLIHCHGSIVVGSKNPVFHTTQSSVTLNELADYPIVMYEQTTADFASELTLVNYHSFRNRITVSNRSTLYEILTHTNAYSISAHINAEEFPGNHYAELRAVPLEDSRIYFEIGYVYRANCFLSSLAMEYLSFLKEIL